MIHKETSQKLYLFLLLIIFSLPAMAQRTSVNIDKGWSFVKDPAGKVVLTDAEKKWSTVDLPHTWNVKDVMDDVPGYYRDAAWYKKTLTVNPAWKNKEVYLVFEAASQEASVYVNGKLAGSHIGGYTRFMVPVSKYLNFTKSNTIAVKVTNRFNENIPPLTADFTFYGGIYRSVSLLAVEHVHFDDSKFGAEGLNVSAPQVTDQTAKINIRGNLVNNTSSLKNIKVVTVLTDRSGKQIKRSETAASLEANSKFLYSQDLDPVIVPHLWSPEDPYLYTSVTTVTDSKTGRILDQLSRNIGLRYFSFDAEKGFFLNGKAVKIMGASRHQDYKGMGNAVPVSLQVKDIALLKAMGGNYLRVAHYPQDQAILDACDKLGILTSVEIPIVNEITETEEFAQNCLRMQTEMIHQNYNHSSTIIWAYMNEVLLRPHFANDKLRQETYFESVAKLAQRIEDLTRKEDPTRYTMIANHGSLALYTRVGITKIPMLVGWNLYQGWYGGKISDFGPNLDAMHKAQPDKPFLVTEYGADADDRIHSFFPERFDKSVEYTVEYHQGYIKDLMSRPFVAGGMIWNLSDFNSETREESMPHINNKGLMTWDRKAKNPYYLYQAALLKKPFVKVGSGVWTLRGGVADAGDKIASQPLQVFSNASEVELTVNGKSLGKAPVTDNVANFLVPFVNGKNTLKAISVVKGVKTEDNSSIDFALQPANLKSTKLPFKAINVVLGGAKRQVVDESKHEVWLEDQLYSQGSWGHVGGEPFKIPNTGRQVYGTDKNIEGTDQDPIYQTQLTGIEAYKLDVPNGKYEVTLHFAELAGSVAQGLIYNLNGTKANSTKELRVFDVYLNDKLIIKDFNIAEQYGIAKAVKKMFQTPVTGGKGIDIQFKAKTGKAVLNAVQVRKVG
jgi:beta-galactosidase